MTARRKDPRARRTTVRSAHLCKPAVCVRSPGGKRPPPTAAPFRRRLRRIRKAVLPSRTHFRQHAQLVRAVPHLQRPTLPSAAGRTCASWELRSSWRAAGPAAAGVRGVLMASARNTHCNHSVSRLTLRAHAGLMMSGPGFLPRPLWRLDPGGRNGEARADLHDKSRVLSAEFGGPWRMAQRKKTAGPLLGPCLFPGPPCRRSCRRSWSEPRPCPGSLPARPAFEQAWLARGGHRGHPFCCVPSGVEICFPHHVPSVPLPVVNPSLPRRRSGTAVGPARTARPDVPATADARPCHA